MFPLVLTVLNSDDNRGTTIPVWTRGNIPMYGENFKLRGSGVLILGGGDEALTTRQAFTNLTSRNYPPALQAFMNPRSFNKLGLL